MTQDLLLKNLFSLNSEKRLEIIRILRGTDELLATSAIASLMNVASTIASRHLNVLAEAELVTRVESGTFALWALQTSNLTLLLKELEKELLPRKEDHHATELTR